MGPSPWGWAAHEAPNPHTQNQFSFTFSDLKNTCLDLLVMTKTHDKEKQEYRGQIQKGQCEARPKGFRTTGPGEPIHHVPLGLQQIQCSPPQWEICKGRQNGLYSKT